MPARIAGWPALPPPPPPALRSRCRGLVGHSGCWPGARPPLRSPMPQLPAALRCRYGGPRPGVPAPVGATPSAGGSAARRPRRRAAACQPVLESAQPSAPLHDPSYASPKAHAAFDAAKKELGVPYLYGGTSPQTGFDCSGLMQWAYRQAASNLPRVAEASSNVGTPVSLNDLREGDLVFFEDRWRHRRPRRDVRGQSPVHRGSAYRRERPVRGPADSLLGPAVRRRSADRSARCDRRVAGWSRRLIRRRVHRSRRRRDPRVACHRRRDP